MKDLELRPSWITQGDPQFTTRVLIRVRQKERNRRGGAGAVSASRWREAEPEGCSHRPRNTRGHQELEAAGRALPESLCREHDPAATWILDFRLQTVREHISAVFGAPACGHLLQEPQECSLSTVFSRSPARSPVPSQVPTAQPWV